jgi:hypothetical protein
MTALGFGALASTAVRRPGYNGMRVAAMAVQVLSQSDLLALVQTGAQLGSEIQLKKLLDLILRSADQLTNSPEAAVLLNDDQASGLYFAATGDQATEVLREWGQNSGKRVPIRGSKAGLVFSTGKPIIDNALESDKAHFKGVDQSIGRATESTICVPLAVVGPTSTAATRLGVVQILNKAGSRFSRYRHRQCSWRVKTGSLKFARPCGNVMRSWSAFRRRR